MTIAVILLVCIVILTQFCCVRAARAGCATYASHDGLTDGYYLQNGCTAIINNYSPCRVVTNSTGAELFVPSYYPGGTDAVGQNEWNSFLAHPPAGVSVASCSCNLPWGGSLTPGQSVTAYQNGTEACHGSCTSQTRTCTCTDSSSLCVLSGSYTNENCSVAACAACSLPWGGSIADGQSVGAYGAASVACGSSCSGQTRTCNNGSLSGSYANQSCSVQPCPCTKPWGGQIANGASVTAYHTASVACGSSCSGQSRICSNGTLSGSYTYQSCSVGSCACAATSHTWNTHCSGAVASKSNGQSVTVTNTAQGYTGSIKATCSNGTWSYANASCAAQVVTCSLPWGGTLANGSSVTAYQISSGTVCPSETRTCSSGSLSGSYNYASCTITAPSCPPSQSCSLCYTGCASMMGQAGDPSQCAAMCSPPTCCY